MRQVLQGEKSDGELQGCAEYLCLSLGQPQSSFQGDFALSFGLETSKATQFFTPGMAGPGLSNTQTPEMD